MATMYEDLAHQMMICKIKYSSHHIPPPFSKYSYLLIGWLYIYGVLTRLFCCALTDKDQPNEVKLIRSFSSLYSRKVTHYSLQPNPDTCR